MEHGVNTTQNSKEPANRNIEEQGPANINNQQNNVESINLNLEQLHINVEGLTPGFNKDITDYYIVIPTSINDIEVLATPEDSKMMIEVIGNTNLKSGKNIIQIKVFLPGTEQSKIYSINVSKTDDENLANSNLENLAIENVTLIPEFSKEILEYRAEVGSDVELLNILAIAENMNARVTIEGNKNLEIGDNEITIKVLAEDGVTEKEYRVLVYKRSKEEEKSKEIQEINKQEKIDKQSKWWIWLIPIVIAICTALGVYLYAIRHNK